MTAPTKSDIKGLGYRMSANADDIVVGYCATIVRDAYLLHYVTQADITSANLGDVIGQAWAALTFLRFLQDTEFGTRTGGERKRFEYGDAADLIGSVKRDVALKLKQLEAVHPKTGEVDDVCYVYFRNQLFN